MQNIIRDFLASVFFIALSVILFILSKNIKVITSMGVSSSFAPKIVSIGMFMLSIILLVQVVITWNKFKKENPKQENEGSIKSVFFQRRYIRVFFTLLLISLYVLLIPIMGFLITTILYLIIQFCLLGEKRHWNIPVFIIIALITSFAIYYTFRLGFQVRLPSGIIG